jgi:hypothetical protein
MTATTVPPGDILPRTARQTAQLAALRREHETLRAQLTDLTRRLEALALEIRQLEDAGEPHAAAPGSRAEDAPALRDLIDALVRGVVRPQPEGSSRKTARPAEPPLRRLAACARGRWLWLAVALGLLLTAGVFLRLVW